MQTLSDFILGTEQNPSWKLIFLENQLLEENNAENNLGFTRQNTAVFSVLNKVMITYIFEKKSLCRAD